MKTVDTTVKPWRQTLKIRAISIDSEELLEFIERHAPGDSEFEASYVSGKNKRTIYESKQELRDYIALLTVPFDLKFQFFSVSFKKDSGATFQFEPGNEHDASRAYKELRQFSPWYSALGDGRLYLISLIIIMIDIFVPSKWYEMIGQHTPLSETTLETAVGYVAFPAVFIVLAQVKFFFFSVRFSHSVRTSFLSRNRDKITTAIIVAFATLILSKAVPIGWRYISEPSTEIKAKSPDTNKSQSDQ